MSRITQLLFIGCLVSLAPFGGRLHAKTAFLQPSRPNRLSIAHTVAVADTTTHLFHVTSRFGNVSQPVLTLALPTWTPGWYALENYAQNILRMRFTDAAGNPVPHWMTRKQTWAIDTRNTREVRVEFDYLANHLEVNQAKITPSFAFFTGSELFLEPVGHRAEPETMRLIVPTGWSILSSLRQTSDSTVFAAENYDELVDAPTEMGHFDVTRYEVDGIPHWLAVTPAGTYPQADYAKATSLFAKIIRAEAAIFRGQPYKKYVAFYFFEPDATHSSGGLEHLNSHVGILSPRPLEAIMPLFAHEVFHAWNVKRIRPVQMWPYDYSGEIGTPLLWVSEGFTDYYGLLARLRAGVSAVSSCCASDSVFLEVAARIIASVESDKARRYESLADASISAWINYGSSRAFGRDYYAGGCVTAMLLDVMLRSDTKGARGLDDIMRWLWDNRYRKNRGFSTTDVATALQSVSGKNYRDFIRRFVEGTDVPPYDSIFASVGYRLILSAPSALESDSPNASHGGTSPMTARFIELPAPTAEQRAIRKAWLAKYP